MARRSRQVIDPFVAPPRRASANAIERGDLRSVRQTFLDRLTMLGATEEEIAAADGSWDNLDDEWTDEYRTQVALDWSDEELALELAAIRGEFIDATSTDVDDSDQGSTSAPDDDAATKTADTQGSGPGDALVTAHAPTDLMGSSIAVIEAWVGADKDRAAAVLAAERAKGDAARSTLVAALVKVLDAGA